MGVNPNPGEVEHLHALMRAGQHLARTIGNQLHCLGRQTRPDRLGELFTLKQTVEKAQKRGRDLLKDLSDQLDQEIANARLELAKATESSAQ